ncbi:MAG: iron(III) transport system substrate-binding protein [Saprospiraceae bacterium]|jgi:iron(III) transport system substrate-binding protein
MKSLYLSLLTLIVMSLTNAQAADAEVNVYSYRKPALIEPMFDVFTEQSGIEVNVVFAKKGMLERLKSEGLNTPADLVFTVDIGRLSDIKNAGLTQSVESVDLNESIPGYARDPQGHWFGLTSRARVIVTSKGRVNEGEVVSYEDLADAKLKGRICTRSAKNAYMVALTASMIAHHGEAQAEQWLNGMKSNLARKPQGNDRAQVKAISEGQCDIAVINHYYMHAMLQDPEQRKAAESVNVVFPNQADRGTHMNISGMALTKHAKNKDNAMQLMTFLASKAAQKMYADVNGEYPISDGIALKDNLAAWGDFMRDEVDLTAVANNRSAAIKMADRVAYDD